MTNERKALIARLAFAHAAVFLLLLAGVYASVHAQDATWLWRSSIYLTTTLWGLRSAQWSLLCIWLIFATRPPWPVRLLSLVGYLGLADVLQSLVFGTPYRFPGSFLMQFTILAAIAGGFLAARASGLKLAQESGNGRARLSLRGALIAIAILSALMAVNKRREAREAEQLRAVRVAEVAARARFDRGETKVWVSVPPRAQLDHIFMFWRVVMQPAIVIWLLSWAVLARGRVKNRLIVAVVTILLIQVAGVVLGQAPDLFHLISLDFVLLNVSRNSVEIAAILLTVCAVRRQGLRWAWMATTK